MRAYELYESKINPIEFCNQTLIGKFGFKESIPGIQFSKILSENFYIVVKAHEHSTTFDAYLFNRTTWKTDETFEFPANERGIQKLLNVITKWTRQYSDADPVVGEAVSSIVEASDLNLTSTNAETEAVIKLIMQVMKSKGYKGKRTNQSAMFEIAFEGPGPRITIDGWHGNGNYGLGKALFTVYVNSKPVIDIAIKHDDLDPTKRTSYWASEDKKQAYLDGLARIKQMFQSGSIFK